jgi:hypothetical protein
MYNKFSENLMDRLCPLLESIVLNESRPDLLVRAQTAAIADALNTLSDFVLENPFSDKLSEINYYKYIYPKFKSLLVYYTEYHSFCSAIPASGVKAKKRYFLFRLHAIADFFEHNRLHYDYFRLDGCMLDEVFYSLGDPGNVLQPMVTSYDPFLGTRMSEMVSWFIAYERLRNEILAQLHTLSGKLPISHTVVDPSGGLQHEIRWTGGDIHLIELVHGIHLTGQVNDGQIGIVELFKVVGDFFGVNLRVPKRGFDDLKARKTMSKTAFLDMMKVAVLKKMDEDDAYDPRRTARRNGF